MSPTGLKTVQAFAKRQLSYAAYDRLHNVTYRFMQPLQWAQGFPSEKRRFFDAHGYPLNLDRPRSFNEKVCWRKLVDRNPLFPVVTDKYRVRDYLRAILGPADAEQYLVPLLFATRDPNAIPFAQLPAQYVVKVNHGSAMNYIVRNTNDVAPSDIRERCRQWMNTTPGLFNNQWAYRKIDRRILVEELVTGEGERPPREIKFHMFGGECGLVQVNECSEWFDGHTLNSGNVVTQTFYTPDWEEVEVMAGQATAPEPAPPGELEEAIEVARRLAAPFDYVRVDFYLTPEAIRFSELTLYPGAGMGRFATAGRDFEIGRLWSLPSRCR